MTKVWTGCFGKLPLHGDFLRRNAFSASVKALDGWLQQGILALRDTLRNDWEKAYDEMPPVRFWFSPKRQGCGLVGVMVPSRDKVGRRFPFLVFHESSAALSAEEISMLPLTASRFLDAAEELATKGWESLSMADLQVRTESLVNETSLDDDAKTAVKSEQDEKITSKTIADVWPHVLGDAGDDGRLTVLQNLADLVRPGYAAQFVLAQPGECVGEVSFWLNVHQRLNGGKPLPSVVAWDSPNKPTDRPLCHRVVYDEPKPAYFLPATRPDLPSRKICHMVNEGLQSEKRIAKSRELFASLLAEQNMPLRTFLDEFPRVLGGRG